ncbi:glycerol-3-phosphate acyltransferase [Candidatus Woesearchaeota archaeon]|nr:glycerol-3-phosphate acyltransferase [Candidatus Woesearchaeota archaeon]
MLKEVLIILIAYLLGSLSPSYFFAWLKGFDLRSKGTKNLGATNTMLSLGKFYGFLVALFDVSKGVLAIYLVYYFGLNELIYYLAGTAAVLGHIFPFYLNFRGGKGVATSVGFIISLLFLDLAFKKWFILMLFLFSAIMTLYRVRKHKNINLNRKIFRCLAFIFPLVYTFISRENMLWLTLIVLFLFLALDLVRIFSDKINKALLKSLKTIAKEKEKRNLSTSSYMLISLVLSVFFFDKNIVILAMFLTIFGDGMAEIYGKCYGQKKIFGKKTFVGSLACFGYCFFLGVVLVQFYNYTYLTIFIGALATTIIELISTRIDDNLTLPFGVSLILRLTRQF